MGANFDTGFVTEAWPSDLLLGDVIRGAELTKLEGLQVHSSIYITLPPDVSCAVL